MCLYQNNLVLGKVYPLTVLHINSLKPFIKHGTKSHIAGIFCNLTKAFDCVSHGLLLCKLQYYGVRDVWLELD
jgi:hypothetical protein